MNITSLIKRHALAAYFILAYAISWGGIFIVIRPAGFSSGDLSMAQTLLVWIAILLGPSLSGLLLTWLTGGRAGLLTLRVRLGHWRVDRRWYATLLITPLLAGTILFVLSLISPDFRPALVANDDKLPLLVLFVALSFGAGVEEIGWTGFATPNVRLRHSVLSTGLLIGALWGGWHFLGDFVGSRSAYGALFLPHFLAYWFVTLITLRLLMTWVYDHTESLFLAWLIHASYTAPLFVLTPPNASGAENFLFEALFASALLVVVVVIVAEGGLFVRPARPVVRPRGRAMS